MVDFADIIARAVYPWIGERSSGTVGEQRMNIECSYRAADNALKALKEAGYELRKA